MMKRFINPVAITNIIGTKYTLPKNQLLCPLDEKGINEYTIPTG
jgi:hypothetical protein